MYNIYLSELLLFDSRLILSHRILNSSISYVLPMSQLLSIHYFTNPVLPMSQLLSIQ